MNETNSNPQSGACNAVRIGDIADWRLLAYISSYGIGAWLKHTDPVQPLVPVFHSNWIGGKEESLLESVENAVFDHPQVLDDFSADMVIAAPRTAIVPTELVADDDEEALRLYNRVYSAESADLMADSAGVATMLFSLVPGLHGFLQRTFPGARLHSHLAVLASRLCERSSDMPRLYIDIRPAGGGDSDINKGEVDFVAFDCRKLLVGVTHSWYHLDDISYHLFNIMQVFGLDPGKTQVSLSGPSVLKTALVQQLRRDIAYVVMTMVPNIGAKAVLPLPVSLLLRK